MLSFRRPFDRNMHVKVARSPTTSVSDDQQQFSHVKYKHPLTVVSRLGSHPSVELE